MVEFEPKRISKFHLDVIKNPQIIHAVRDALR